MRFGTPYMSILLWLVPAMIIFYHFAEQSRKKALKHFADDKVLPEILTTFNIKKRKIRTWMIGIAVFLMLISLMRPQWGFTWKEVKQRGIDILIALDTSKSMLAEDVLPNRLERSKLAIKDLVKKLHGDRVGLVVFAGTAFLQCPLTVDYDGFMLTLDDVDVFSIPVGGTSLSNAIYTAIESYEEGGASEEDRILIIITDGEDLEGGVERAVHMAKAAGVRIFCVGIGSPEGELIPIKDDRGRPMFLKDQEGNVVKTRLVEETLEKIAVETGGMYVRSTGAEFGLDLIYDKELSKLEKRDFKARMEKRYHDRFQIPLIFAFLLLLIEPLIGDRKKGSEL